MERWFAELTNRKLRRSAHRSVAELEADLRKWIKAWNNDPKPFVWTTTADQILDTLADVCPRFTQGVEYLRPCTAVGLLADRPRFGRVWSPPRWASLGP